MKTFMVVFTASRVVEIDAEDEDGALEEGQRRMDTREIEDEEVSWQVTDVVEKV